MIYFQNMFLFELTGAHNVFVIEILWFVHKCNNLIIFMAFLLETFSVDEQYLDAVTVKKKIMCTGQLWDKIDYMHMYNYFQLKAEGGGGGQCIIQFCLRCLPMGVNFSGRIKINAVCVRIVVF